MRMPVRRCRAIHDNAWSRSVKTPEAKWAPVPWKIHTLAGLVVSGSSLTRWRLPNFRRAGLNPDPNPKQVLIREPAERTLAIELLAFGTVVQEVATSLEFHRLAQYLYTLASTFTAFYERCPVLKADAEIHDSRLVLCDLTARTLKTGLELLGIESPDQM